MARPSPRRCARTRSACHSWTGSDFPFSSCSPALAYAMAASDARRVASPTRTDPGLCRALRARCRVDQVSGDHALPFGVDGDGRLAGLHRGAKLEPLRACGLRERVDRVNEVERGADGTLGVVLARDRGTPQRHHRVADELLHRAAVALDHRARRVEVAGLQLPHVLEVAALRQRRVADEVGEQDADEPSLRLRRPSRRGCRRCHRRGQRCSALATELAVGRVGGSARRARHGERRAAFLAELAAASFVVPQLVQVTRGLPGPRPRESRRSRICRASASDASVSPPAATAAPHSPQKLRAASFSVL